MKVLKFGGTSMRNAEAWKNVLNIINNTGAGTVTVVSATSGTTNALLQAAEVARSGKLEDALSITAGIKASHNAILDEFFGNADAPDRKIANDHLNDTIKKLDTYLLGVSTLGELTPKSLDAISSTGEQLSSFLLVECGKKVGMNAVWVDSAEVLKTDSSFGEAKPNFPLVAERAEIIRAHSNEGAFIILGGFYGSDSNGVVTTLGRGGSDYSASIFALASGADVIEIWTDVSGMFTSDPRFIKHAFSIKELSFNEAAELAYFGAKVLHPATIQPAVERNIPVYVKNTFEPNHPGTRIFSDTLAETPVRAIAFKKDITVITIISSRMLLAWGFLSKVFDVFNKHQVSVDLVTTSEVSISMTVDKKARLDKIIDDLENIGTVKIYENQALISLVGKDLLKSKGIAAQAFNSLSKFPIRMISQGSSDNNLSVVVENDDAIEAVQNLHDAFFVNQPTPENV